MAKKTRYAPEIPPEKLVMGVFTPGENIPLKSCWFKVAHVEDGVLVLALDGYTKRGIEIIAHLRAQLYANTNTNEAIHTTDGDGALANNPSGAQIEAGEQHDLAAAPDIS